MTFGEALEELKKGRYVARRGWRNECPPRALALCEGFYGKMVAYVGAERRDYGAIDGHDVLAEDWEIL